MEQYARLRPAWDHLQQQVNALLKCAQLECDTHGVGVAAATVNAKNLTVKIERRRLRPGWDVRFFIGEQACARKRLKERLYGVT